MLDIWSRAWIYMKWITLYRVELLNLDCEKLIRVSLIFTIQSRTLHGIIKLIKFTRCWIMMILTDENINIE